MTLRRLLTVSLFLLPMMASANDLVDGQRVPPLKIADMGELILGSNDDISYKSWDSSQFDGKVRIVQYIAGRSSAKKKIHS